jgi:acylphosphatase
VTGRGGDGGETGESEGGGAGGTRGHAGDGGESAGGGETSGGETGRGGDFLALRWLVRGRVQGVGFRFHTRGHARHLGLAGRVRNLPGGEVEIDVAGPAAQVRQLETLVRQGPPGAYVTGLEERRLGDGAAAAWEGRFDIDSHPR